MIRMNIKPTDNDDWVRVTITNRNGDTSVRDCYRDDLFAAISDPEYRRLFEDITYQVR